MRKLVHLIFMLAFYHDADQRLRSGFTQLFGEGYYSPDSMSSGVDDYVEANAGLRINVLPSLNIEAGYRYIDMAGKDGNRDNTLADGAYAGVNFRF